MADHTLLDALVSAAARWLEHRRRRLADLERLRGATGGSTAREHPLWQAERELADLLARLVECRSEDAER